MSTKRHLPPVDQSRPFQHLAPLVAELLEAGNTLAPAIGDHRPNAAGFYQDKDGWICDLVKPIDFGRLRSAFELPSFLRLNEEQNAISCDRTWTQIRGNVSA